MPVHARGQFAGPVADQRQLVPNQPPPLNLEENVTKSLTSWVVGGRQGYRGNSESRQAKSSRT